MRRAWCGWICPRGSRISSRPRVGRPSASWSSSLTGIAAAISNRIGVSPRNPRSWLACPRSIPRVASRFPDSEL
ncbi:MAG: 4Fe-4S binding protein [Planctomycetaceae bacterium]